MSRLLLILTVFVLVTSCDRDSDDTPTTQSPNYADSIKRGLWSYFPFTNGSFGDSSGSGHHMRGVNGVAFGADKSGNTNRALQFDGINDYAVIDSGINFPAGNFAVSFLMKAERTIGGRIFNKANFNDAKGASINFGFDDDNGTNKLNFAINNNNNICNTLWTAGSASNLYTNTVITQNIWYSVVAEHINGVMRVYLNGQLIAAIASQNMSFIPCSNAPIYFGIWWLNDFKAFKGTLDNIRIYTRALTYKEIQYLTQNSL